MGRSPIRADWAFHGLSALLMILAALSAGGIWYDASTYLGDLWTAFDAMHKTEQGLRSSIDYFSPLGPGVQWFYGLALLVRPASAATIVLANLLAAALALLLSVLLLRRRATALTIALVGLIAVSTALSPRDIDVPDMQSSLLAPYNRWCWALFLPVAMRAALPLSRANYPGAVLTGAAIALLLLIKVTYGLAALGLIAVALLIQPSRWREVGCVGITVLVSLVICDILTQAQVRAYVADLSATSNMPANGLRPSKFFLQLPSLALFTVGSLILILAAVRSDGESPVKPLLRYWRAAVMAGAVGASGMVVLMQNHYLTEATSLLLMPLVVAEWTSLFANISWQPHSLWRRRGEWIALVVLVCLARPAYDAGQIFAQPVQMVRKPRLPELAGTEFHDLIVEGTHRPSPSGSCADSTCQDYQRMLMGRELLRRYCLPRSGRSILAANFSNPFPALLKSRSPAAAPIWLHMDRSFSKAVHIPADRLLGDVDCLIEARGEPNSVLFMTIYGDAIRRDFLPVGRDSYWQLWKRAGI